jgi:hypothetical protein
MRWGQINGAGRAMEAPPGKLVESWSMAGEKCFTQRFMEGLGLEFPKDADRFLEIFTRFGEEDGTIGQLIDDVMKDFSE